MARLLLPIAVSLVLLPANLCAQAPPSHAPTPFAVLLEQAQEHSKKGKHAEAAPLWQQVVKLNPTSGEFWVELAKALYQTKDYRPAIAAYQRGLECGHSYPANYWYDIARCHALLGEKAPALASLEKALERGYRDLQQARTEGAFESLRDAPKFKELVALADVSKMSRDDGWRFDLDLLAREIKRMHYNPFRKVTRAEFDDFVSKLHDDIPRLADNEIMAGFMRLGQMAGDGHTFVRPGGAPKGLPIQLFQFEDGIFVTAAAPEHAELAGAELRKVGKHTTAEVLAALAPVISRDNAMGLKAMGPRLVAYPKLLNGLGLISDADKATLTLRDADGKERTVTLSESSQQPSDKWTTARKDAALPEPLYLKNRTAPYWFEHLPETKLVYCQHNNVRNDKKEPLDKFCDRLFQFIRDKNVDKLVIDLRWNGGGNTFLNKPLIHGLIRCDQVNQRGKLFVIVGRHTFSAAQNCATDLQMHTKALFVGEPTGSSPNFIGETVRFTLPYSKMEGSISDLYWQRSWPMDHRTWIPPDIYAPPTFALYKANRDPALEAILQFGRTTAQK